MKTKIFTKCIFLSGLLSLGACNDYLDIVPKGEQLLTTVEDYANLMNAEEYNILFPIQDIAFVAGDLWATPSNIRRFNNGAYGLGNLAWCASEDIPRDSYYDPGKLNSLYTGCYVHINRVANLIFSGIGEASGSEALKARTIAEARVLRAYNYFMLINVYSKHYDPATAATDGGVPFVDEFNLDASPRQASVAEIYQLIENDLAAAIASGALVDVPTNPYHPSKAMGYALKAKVHLFKKEWAQAKEAALESHRLNDYVFDMVPYVNAGMPTKVYANDAENLYYALAGGSISATGGGIPDNSAISPELRDLFDPRIPANTNPAKLPKDFNPAEVDDVRYAGWFDYTTTAAGTDQDKDYVPVRNNSHSNYCVNTAGMRTTEVILMLAELCARENDFDGMNLYLDKVRSKRIRGYVAETYMPSDWVEGVKIVMNERRKELMFGFNRFFDLRRLNAESELRAPLKRIAPANPNIGPGGSSTAYHDLPQKEYVIAPDSRWWIALFPRAEMEHNENIKQNIDK